MPISSRGETVELGHVIVIEIIYTDCVRTRTIRIGTKDDHGAQPPVHTERSDFVKAFLGKARGEVAIIDGSRGSQEWEYETTLVDILGPSDLIDPSRIDSWRPIRLAA